MEIKKYGIDSEKLTSQNVQNLSPTPNAKPLDKTFGNLLKDAINEVNINQKVSEQAMADMATGQIKDLHQAAIAIGKAENSMKLMLEVRNKAINAYKELIKTQI